VTKVDKAVYKASREYERGRMTAEQYAKFSIDSYKKQDPARKLLKESKNSDK